MSQIPHIQELIRGHFLENTKHESKLQNSDGITVEDPSFIKLILESFADEDKKIILHSVLYESKTILEILDSTEIPRTSGYRKIHSLIDSGLLMVQNHPNARNIKNGKKYKSIFENIAININQNSVVIKVLFPKEVLEKYSPIKITQN